MGDLTSLRNRARPTVLAALALLPAGLPFSAVSAESKAPATGYSSTDVVLIVTWQPQLASATV
jgi:hypothetical protein